MNVLLKNRWPEVAIYLTSMLIAVLLAYGVLQQKIAVDEEKLMSQDQQIGALNLRITSLEVASKNNATITDIANLRGDIKTLSNNFQTFVQGFVTNSIKNR